VYPIGERQAVYAKMREVAAKYNGTLENTVYGGRIKTEADTVQLTIITTVR
jgi:hypothetical protein